MLIALIVLSGVAELAVALVQHRTVHELSEEIQPLEVANTRLRSVLNDAQWGLRGYLQTGDEQLLAMYEVSRGEYSAAALGLHALAAAGADREVLDGAETWWRLAEQYRGAVPGSADAVDFIRQSTLIHQGFLVVSQGLQDELADRAERLRRRSEALRWFTIALILLITAGAVSTAVCYRRRFVGPLRDVADVLARRRAGDLGARAAVTGPAEIRAVAEAINAGADQDATVRGWEQKSHALDTAKTDFMATVSHELRTPLTSICGYLEVLRDAAPGDLTDTQRQMLDVIARNTRRLRELIEDILTLSRIETGDFVSDLDELDFAEVVERAVVAIGPEAAKASVGLHTDVRGPLPMRGDRAQLDRVLANLLSNAVKFTKTEGTITVRAEHRDGGTVLVVADTGMGIPAAEREALPARFVRASNAVRQAVPGTGLGLAITKTIIDNHRGTIGVESSENVGTTVTVRFPAF